MGSPPDLTAFLDEWGRGVRRALDQLLPLVYAELRRIAARQLRRERAGHTLQPTALVNEAYLRLMDQRKVDWRNRAHFFGVAAQVMRRIPSLSIDPAMEAAPSDLMSRFSTMPMSRQVRFRRCTRTPV